MARNFPLSLFTTIPLATPFMSVNHPVTLTCTKTPPTILHSKSFNERKLELFPTRTQHPLQHHFPLQSSPTLRYSMCPNRPVRGITVYVRCTRGDRVKCAFTAHVCAILCTHALYNTVFDTNAGAGRSRASCGRSRAACIGGGVALLPPFAPVGRGFSVRGTFKRSSSVSRIRTGSSVRACVCVRRVRSCHNTHCTVCTIRE